MPKLQRDSYELCSATKPLRIESFHDQFGYTPETKNLGPVLLRPASALCASTRLERVLDFLPILAGASASCDAVLACTISLLSRGCALQSVVPCGVCVDSVIRSVPRRLRREAEKVSVFSPLFFTGFSFEEGRREADLSNSVSNHQPDAHDK